MGRKWEIKFMSRVVRMELDVVFGRASFSVWFVMGVVVVSLWFDCGSFWVLYFVYRKGLEGFLFDGFGCRDFYSLGIGVYFRKDLILG